jgi:hypothetical protein
MFCLVVAHGRVWAAEPSLVPLVNADASRLLSNCFRFGLTGAASATKKNSRAALGPETAAVRSLGSQLP